MPSADTQLTNICHATTHAQLQPDMMPAAAATATHPAAEAAAALSSGLQWPQKGHGTVAEQHQTSGLLHHAYVLVLNLRQLHNHAKGHLLLVCKHGCRLAVLGCSSSSSDGNDTAAIPCNQASDSTSVFRTSDGNSKISARVSSSQRQTNMGVES